MPIWVSEFWQQPEVAWGATQFTHNPMEITYNTLQFHYITHNYVKFLLDIPAVMTIYDRYMLNWLSEFWHWPEVQFPLITYNPMEITHNPLQFP